MKQIAVIVAPMALGVMVGTGWWMGTRPEPVALSAKTGEGQLFNQRGHNRPGDIERGERALRKIYAAMVAYRDRHGRLPTSPHDLFNGYGLKPSDLDNPDYELADCYNAEHRNGIYGWPYIVPRHDGARKPAFPANGERDVWALTDIYVRRNAVVHPNETLTDDPTGYHLLLWSDGTIERVRPQDKLWFRSADRKVWTRAWRGEAGLPSNVMTAAEAGRIAGTPMH